MGFFRNLLDAFSTARVSDKFGPGAGLLYAEYAGERASDRELSRMKTEVSKSVMEFINEQRKYLNTSIIDTLNSHVVRISNSNQHTFDINLNELRHYIDHDCAYFSCVNNILSNSLKALEALPDDVLDDGDKEKVILKTKETMNCSNSSEMPLMLKKLFALYDECGVEVENKDELFIKFNNFKEQYLQ